MQTTSTRERNTMKKVLLTLIATGSATIAAVIAFASPASAEIVEICTTLDMETFTVVIEPCEDNGPLIDPNEGNEEDINIDIDLGTDFDFDWTPIDPVDPEEEDDGIEEDVDDSAEETIEENADVPVDPEEEDDGTEEDVDDSAQEIVEENVGLGIEEDIDESAEETIEENADVPAEIEEIEEIAITDEAPETEEGLPVTGGMHLYMISIAGFLLALGITVLTINKLTVRNLNR